METYAQILGDLGDTTHGTLVRPPHALPPRANIDRMLRSATTALQMFQPLSQQYRRTSEDVKGSPETEKKSLKARADRQVRLTG